MWLAASPCLAPASRNPDFTGANTRRRSAVSRSLRQDGAMPMSAVASERNLVVEIGTRRAPLRPRAAAAAAITAALIGAPRRSAATLAAAVEHGQLTAEALEHHLGRVFLDPRLVGPFARLQCALDIDLRALLEILLRYVDEVLIEDDDPVPLRTLLALAGILVAPALRGGERQIGNAGAVLSRANFRIAAEIADENDFVDAASHGFFRP